MSNPFNIFDWKFDKIDGTFDGKVSITRHRLGPLTFYKFNVKFGTEKHKDQIEVMAICPWDNVMLQFALPKFGK